jgi:glycosyltransferase involved in cell wall biosynthesis
VDKQKNYVSYDLIKGDRPYLLYVGVRSGYKNFKLFLKGVSQSSKLLLEFDVISFGGGAFNTAELDYIKSLGFRHDQVGQLSGGDEVLNSLYKGAAAFVYPSLYEGFGLPLLEAMVCMCPIICSNSSSMPEVVGDAAEYFNPMITEDISVAIERVVFSESRSLELVEKGLGRVKKYSWKKCAQETLAVYKNLLGDSSAF